MKKKIMSLVMFILIPGMMLVGQNIPESLQKRGEIYFSFPVKAHSEINTLTKLISIDNVKDHTVYAYANMKQYVSFLKLGYDITVLPVPGEAPGVVMTDHITLGPLTTWNYYPTYPAYEALMTQFQTTYPAICKVETIGTLASGRKLLALKISDNVNTDESEPEFFYTSSIHGDEVTGYILMLHLADYLLSNYGTNAEATDLINNLEIYINPLSNPDGTYYGGDATVNGARRYNINGVDMNRNYPDPQDGQHPDGYAWQPETMAFMDFASQHHFVASCNFHGGAEVVNYPWDTWPTLNADDTYFQYISREYADTVHLHAPSTYMDDLNNGVTNGYAWYEVNGGRQDYMNYYQHCFEMTIELSNTKLLPTTSLLTHWDYNWRSLINLIKEAKYGIHGIITDQSTGLPVVAKVAVVGHDDANSTGVYSSANNGDYHRLLKGGTYTLEISASCYQTQTITGVVVADHVTKTLNIQLVPGGTGAITTTAVTSIAGSTAMSGGNIICAGGSYVTARGVCWGTAANPVVTGSHTTDGSGLGVFTSQLTGLAPSTGYHVRAYATNSSGTTYGADVAFTSSCGVVSSFPWNESFENAGSIPGCWTQEQVNSSGVNWTFITGGLNGHPATAHGGTYNACLKDNTAADNKTRLISPPFNLTGVSTPQVKFWHTQALYTPDQDQLSVYYKTSLAGTWTLLNTYTTNLTAWTQETISLPNPSAEYYIAFEGNAKYGYGVCLDDVQVASSCTSTLPVSNSISASGNPVCAGTSATFTATPTNGGTTPAYQWKVNSINAGTNSASFNYTPANNDVVTCVLTSNATCITGNPATSNAITMTVNPVLAVSLSIAPSSDHVCAGTSVTFTPAPVNGGTPQYQWFKNSAPVGTGATYSCVPLNGDQVYATLTSSLTCKSGSPATSNTVTMAVDPVLAVGISITASANPVMAGTTVAFSAVPVNEGVSPVYQWFVNGSPVGTNSTSFSYVPVDGNQVYCVLTASESCFTSNPANSNTILMTVNAVPSTRELQNMEITSAKCFNAIQTITVAGNETYFTVQSGGNAKMIAGENILFLPGTVVATGGYLYGYIAPDGPWCLTPSIPAVVAGAGEQSWQTAQSSIKIYPNPTSGDFTLEMAGFDSQEKVLVELFGMKGEKVMSTELTGARKHRFSISGKAPGIYLLQVISGKQIVTTRIIKGNF